VKIAIIVQWLALLACPVMMLWCMWSMFGSHKHRGTGSPKDDVRGEGDRDLAAEIRALQARLAQLEAERARDRQGLTSE